MGTMDNIIDKIADTTENMKDKVAEKLHHDDDTATEASGDHRGEAAAEEPKHGLMDRIADATEKLVEKYDHSELPPTAGPVSPPAEIPAVGMNMDPTGKV